MSSAARPLQFRPPTTANPSAFKLKDWPRCAAWSDPKLAKELKANG